MEVSSGFAIRIFTLAKNLPYPVKVILPPIKGQPAPQAGTPHDEKSLILEIPACDDRHTKLGKFMDAWSLLEQTLCFTLDKMLQAGLQVADIIASSNNLRDLITLISSLASRRASNTDYDKLIKLLDRVTKLNSRRNSLVHGHWVLETYIVIVDNAPALKSQFVREKPPTDHQQAELLHDPHNQAIRAKHTYTLKRIEGVTKDVEALTRDIAVFNEMALSPT